MKLLGPFLHMYCYLSLLNYAETRISLHMCQATCKQYVVVSIEPNLAVLLLYFIDFIESTFCSAACGSEPTIFFQTMI